MGQPSPRKHNARRTVHGPAGLTGREREVMGRVADRMTNAEIAQALVISQRTVESHVSSLLRKFEVTSRADLIAAWWTTERGPTHSGRPPAGALPEPLNRLLTGAFVGRSGELSTLHEAFDASTSRVGRSSRSCAARPASGSPGCSPSSRPPWDEARRCAWAAATISPGRRTCRSPRSCGLMCATAPTTNWRSLVGSDAGLLAGLMPDLSERLRRAVPDDTDWGSSDRHSMFESVRRYLSRAADLRPLVVVVEDVHWADDDVVALIRHLSRHLESGSRAHPDQRARR